MQRHITTNQVTGKQVCIKSAQRLRGPAAGRGPTLAEADAVAKAIGHAPANAPVKKKLTRKDRDTLRAKHKAHQAPPEQRPAAR